MKSCPIERSLNRGFDNYFQLSERSHSEIELVIHPETKATITKTFQQEGNSKGLALLQQKGYYRIKATTGFYWTIFSLFQTPEIPLSNSHQEIGNRGKGPLRADSSACIHQIIVHPHRCQISSLSLLISCYSGYSYIYLSITTLI